MTDLTNWNKRVYLLDANVLISAHNEYYAPDLFPGFWECLEHYCGEGQILSIDRIRAELLKPPALVAWADSINAKMFQNSQEAPVVDVFNQIMAWVEGNQQFKDEAKRKFAKVADGWLIAYAKCYEAIVVTHEAYRPNAKNRVLIPNVCREFDVGYVTTYEMLRELGGQFYWRRN